MSDRQGYHRWDIQSYISHLASLTAAQPPMVPVTQFSSAFSSPQSPAQRSPGTMVSLRGVTKVYGRSHRGLWNVNLEIPTGSFMAIAGASGAGKSTLLKLLYGEEQPDQGNVTVNGQEVTGLQGNKLAYFRRHVGIVFQDYKLLPRR
ncbi:MAG: ATP-binding cassette domain-containing protein, partial [Cyanobacteria bacterium P01_H01_bin.130]